MFLLIVLILFFIFLLILPFAVSLTFVNKKREATINIKSDNVRDPRYFPKSFSNLIDKGISEEHGIVVLSREERFVWPDRIKNSVCKSIVYSKEDFNPQGVKEFQKEIYAKASATIEPNTKIRAVACKDVLELGENCEVIRWIDGENLVTARSGCYLGISATSANKLVIEPGCIFRRLYAPEISIGKSEIKTVYQFPDQKIYPEFINDIKKVARNRILHNTIVTNNSLKIGENVVVYGSVKTAKDLLIRENTIIMGNVVADGEILIEQGVKIGGSVFTQDSIVIGPDVQIGVKPKIKSLIAKNDIILCENSDVFGYIGCEGEGSTITVEEFNKHYSEGGKKRSKKFRKSKNEE